MEITDNSSQIPVNVGWVALNSNWGATGSEGGVKNPLEKHGLESVGWFCDRSLLILIPLFC